MTKVLVFGGAGYIGSHTCKALCQSGLSPTVFDNLSEGHRDFVKWGELIEGDIGDVSDVQAAIAAAQPDAIINFAAYAYVGESVVHPSKYYRNNVAGMMNIAEAAKSAGNIPVVFSSSCATYGVPPDGLISEDTVQSPINPYGRTKLIGEQLLSDFGAAYGLPFVCLRYFNACGADADGEIGERHRIETHLVPRAILAACGVIDDFAVFGNDYETPDGSAVRDYIHVTDLAEAHVAACRYLLQGGASDMFNVGTGHGISVLEIIEAVKDITGLSVPYDTGPRREGDPPSLIANPAKARRVLGFVARNSDLTNIVATATGWHKRDMGTP